MCFLKLPASLSGKVQPCDVMALFMNTRLAIFLMEELTEDNIMLHHGVKNYPNRWVMLDTRRSILSH